MFQYQRKGSLSSQGKSLKDLTRIVNADLFFAEEKRHALLKKIHALTSLESSRYESLCHVLMNNLVHYCQYLPDTLNNYYSQPGGLVDHALNRTEAALSLFQDFIAHDSPETLSEAQKLWQYALFSAAILQGIGKLFVEYRIALYDANGHFLKEWNPLLESLVSRGSYYFHEFQKESEVELRRRLNLLLAKALMPSSGFAWIASNPEVLAVWLALLNEDERSAGTLGALLIRAEAISIQRYLLEFIMRGFPSSGGRYRAGTFSGVQPESLLEKEQALGIEFLQWMIQSLDKGMIMINKAPLFMVPGGLLMCPEIFQLFVREHSEYKNWQAVKNGFLALGLHKLSIDGDVMSRFEAKNQKMQTGIVFSKYALALPESVKLYNLNTAKVESISATELIHKAQFNSPFIQANLNTVPPLTKLNSQGQWQSLENERLSLKPGAKNGV